MTYDAYKATERTHYLSDPLREITGEWYDYALEVLPPLDYRDHQGLRSFLLREFQADVYTQQYVLFQGRCYCRLVDATDKKTWITREELLAAQHGA